MVDNLIPYIGGEEMKSKRYLVKLKVKKSFLQPGKIECQTYRVPVSNSHTAAIFFSFKDSANKPSVRRNRKMWAEYKVFLRELNLPHAPKQFIHVYTERTLLISLKLKLPIDGGMAISCGRLRRINTIRL